MAQQPALTVAPLAHCIHRVTWQLAPNRSLDHGRRHDPWIKWTSGREPRPCRQPHLGYATTGSSRETLPKGAIVKHFRVLRFGRFFAMSGLVFSLAAAVLVARSAGLTAQAEKLGDRPARPAPFAQVGHIHHSPNSVDGSQTPDLIPTRVATNLLLRSLSTAKRADDGDGRHRIAQFVEHIERKSGYQFNPFDRKTILAWAAGDVLQRGPVRRDAAETSWNEMLSRVNPDARKALRSFLDNNVKRHTKLLR